MISFSLIDYIALAWFGFCWIGYLIYADYSPMHKKSISYLMNGQRQRWMRNMIGRELRMIDTTIQSNLISGVAFFASTSILLVGGLLAALGATEQAVEVLKDLPLAQHISHEVWEAKVLLLLIIFIYAFFKFAWCHRLFQYCAILLGAAPLEQNELSDQGREFVKQAARMHGLSGLHFLRGLRAYFFALAGLAWFINAWLFIVATTWVTVVLYRREFRSRSYDILRKLDQQVEDQDGPEPNGDR